MLTFEQMVAELEHLEAEMLQEWIERGWVRPGESAGGYQFQAADEARVRLIWEIHHDLNVPHDAMPMILSLLDQVYGLRYQLRTLTAAVERQPSTVRDDIIRLLRGDGK